MENLGKLFVYLFQHMAFCHQDGECFLQRKAAEKQSCYENYFRG
jgi:hypothetical protein